MTRDAFDELGMRPGFEVDEDEIERAVLTRLAEVHPDVSGDDRAAIESARINAARHALIDPERRAWTLLRRLTGGAAMQDRSLPEGFLPEIMEVREAIEAATASHDEAEVSRWRSWAAARREEHIARVGEMFRQMGDSPPPDAVVAMVRELNAWRYIERLLEQISGEGARAGAGGEAP